MILGTGLSRSVVYDLLLWNYVEGLGGYHEVTDAFTEITDMNYFVPKELFSVPSSNDHYCFRIYLWQEDLHGKYWSEGVGTYLFV